MSRSRPNAPANARDLGSLLTLFRESPARGVRGVPIATRSMGCSRCTGMRAGYSLKSVSTDWPPGGYAARLIRQPGERPDNCAQIA
jgi:hypothetical protein